MKALRSFAAALAMVASVGAAQAAVITLTIPGSGTTKVILDDLDLGNALTFEYRFAQVVWLGGNFIDFNAQFIDPCCGPSTGTISRNQATDWAPYAFNTVGRNGLYDLAFEIQSFNPANSAVVEIRNVAIDGTVVAGAPVPAPGVLALLAAGLLGIGAAARRTLQA